MDIVDSYKFPAGCIGGSPQFIPRQGNTGDSTDGYLICTVFTPDKSEYWIFDGKDLAKGAICKLSHPDLSFSLTLHTAWLPKIGKRQAGYCIPVREDYQDIVENSSQDIQNLFKEAIYPHFE